MKLLAYMWYLRGIFVSGIYFTLMCEVSVAVGCIFVDMYINVGSLCPFSIIAVSAIFAMLKPYLFSDTANTCMVASE